MYIYIISQYYKTPINNINITNNIIYINNKKTAYLSNKLNYFSKIYEIKYNLQTTIYEHINNIYKINKNNIYKELDKYYNIYLIQINNNNIFKEYIYKKNLYVIKYNKNNVVYIKYFKNKNNLTIHKKNIYNIEYNTYKEYNYYFYKFKVFIRLHTYYVLNSIFYKPKLNYLII